MTATPKLIRGNLIWNKEKTALTTCERGWIYIESGVIRAILSPEEGETIAQRGVAVEDYGERILIPGLVDLHVHAPQYAFRGTGMDLELLDWLEAYTFPEESRYDDSDYGERAYTQFADGLKNSPTTRACIFATIHVPATLRLMELLEERGLGAYVGKVSMDRDCPDSLRETEGISALRDWLTRWKESPLVCPILTPRFVPSCTEELLEGLGTLQREFRLPVQSHLSENPAEVELVKALCPEAETYGHAYARHGLFGGEGCPTIMAHCVYSSPKEIELLEKNQVFVAHCPQSNANLASGIAPVREYLRRGIPVGLGTDVAAGHSLSMFRAVTDAIQVSKLRWRLVDPKLPPLSFPEALWLATRGGGAFFGQVGLLAPGFDCDLLVLDDHDLPAPRKLSLEERLERLFYLGGDQTVFAKYVRGRRVK